MLVSAGTLVRVGHLGGWFCSWKEDFMPHHLLLVDEDVAYLQATRKLLVSMGYRVEVASEIEEAKNRLAQRPVDGLLLDIDIAGESGIDLFSQALEQGRTRTVVVVSESGGIPKAVQVMRQGASDFLPKPVTEDELRKSLTRALGKPNHGGLDEDERRAWRDEYCPNFIGDDPKMLEIFGIIERVAATNCNVLVTGPTGAGKELVAKAMHDSSERRDAPFVALNCAAIPKDLMESEMFGHTKGAFTSADGVRQGKFEVADGGTLFLDEIGEMNIELQSKLLRVIQEREFTPVGANKAKKVDVRIISATHQDLLKISGEGRFREDLFYRLNVIPIALPPLKERLSDVPRLAGYFVKRLAVRHGRTIAGIDEAAKRALAAYEWPGNVRELENTMERIVVLKRDEGLIMVSDLPTHLSGLDASRGDLGLTVGEIPEEGIDLKSVLEEIESKYIVEALKSGQGNKTNAAKVLGMKRTTLIERLKRLDLEDF